MWLAIPKTATSTCSRDHAVCRCEDAVGQESGAAPTREAAETLGTEEGGGGMSSAPTTTTLHDSQVSYLVQSRKGEMVGVWTFDEGDHHQSQARQLATQPHMPQWGDCVTKRTALRRTCAWRLQSNTPPRGVRTARAAANTSAANTSCAPNGRAFLSASTSCVSALFVGGQDTQCAVQGAHLDPAYSGSCANVEQRTAARTNRRSLCPC